jgi:hypothetical protein
LWIKCDRAPLVSSVFPTRNPADHPIFVMQGSEWGRAPHSTCPSSRRGLARRAINLSRQAISPPRCTPPIVAPPARRAFVCRQNSDPTKIPSPCSPSRQAAIAASVICADRGRSHGDAFGRKSRPQRRTQEQERVLIFVGSGCALRAAANLPRVAGRLRMAEKSRQLCVAACRATPTKFTHYLRDNFPSVTWRPHSHLRSGCGSRILKPYPTLTRTPVTCAFAPMGV